VIVAHGIAVGRELPIPEWMLYWGAAIVLVISFVLLGVLWKSPQLSTRTAGRPAPELLSRIALSTALCVVLQAVSVGLLVLVFVSAAFGVTDPFRNLAPTWIYIVFWLGLPLLSVLFGNVWRALSPWRALADAYVWVRERGGATATPLAEYPARWGRWPAAGLLFAFAALELAYTEPASPRALALAIALYTYITLFGMAAFGREPWTRNGEAFAVLFGFFALISPWVVADGRLRVRIPFSGLSVRDATPGTVPFIAVMLGSVGFDGYSRTTTWLNLTARIEAPYIVDNPRLGDLLVTGARLGGLLVGCGLVAAAFLAACAVAADMVDTDRPLASDFVLSLVPIAFVYEVAHYFYYFITQGPFTIRLLSDPLGRGWDVLGTADYVPNPAPLSFTAVSFVQFTALVAGHMAGLAIAHDRAVTIFPDRRAALRSQYAMLALMVLYTVGGLWLLRQG
jgi:hypothetical protein